LIINDNNNNQKDSQGRYFRGATENAWTRKCGTEKDERTVLPFPVLYFQRTLCFTDALVSSQAHV